MKKIIGLVVIGCIIFFLAKGIANANKEEEILSINKLQKQNGIPVMVAKVDKRDLQNTIRYYGDVHAVMLTTISAKLMDNVSEVLVNVGDYVREGQPVLRYDSTGSQASVIQARLALEQSKRDLERGQRLFEQGAISKQNLEGLELHCEINEQNYLTARKMLTLPAPKSGRVAKVEIKPGDLTHPGDPVVILMKEDKLEIQFDVPQQDRGKLIKGQKISTKVGNRQIDGKITEINMTTNNQSRMFKVFAEIPYTDGVYPGMLITVDVVIADKKGVSAIPTDAIIGQNAHTVVYTIDGEKVSERKISTGIQDNQYMEVTAGLRDGDLVAVYGMNNLSDGAKVKVVEE